ncbi:hypothetical protein ACQPYH_28480 [Kribbella sp. CA-245084]|uniref:hypothetical protein n=1 Tax=Kribbella sp. CA-245084 TaxID=3239940 RepID=UPI003D91BE3D
MFRNVYLKSLYDARRGLTGWSIAIVALVLLESALWPSVRDMLDVKDLYQSFPEQLRKFFNLEAMATGTGFLNAELFTIMLPGLFLVYGIGHGARTIAGEEERAPSSCCWSPRSPAPGSFSTRLSRSHPRSRSSVSLCSRRPLSAAWSSISASPWRTQPAVLSR